MPGITFTLRQKHEALSNKSTSKSTYIKSKDMRVARDGPIRLK